MKTRDLTINQRISVKAEWLKGRVSHGVVVKTSHVERYKGENDWLKKYAGLNEDTILFKPDNDGHQRIVHVCDIIG